MNVELQPILQPRRSTASHTLSLGVPFPFHFFPFSSWFPFFLFFLLFVFVLLIDLLWFPARDLERTCFPRFCALSCYSFALGAANSFLAISRSSRRRIFPAALWVPYVQLLTSAVRVVQMEGGGRGQQARCRKSINTKFFISK